MVSETTFFIPRRSTRVATGDRGLVHDSIPPGLANQLAGLIDGAWRLDRSKFERLFRQTWVTLGRDPDSLRAPYSHQRRLLQSLLTDETDVTEFLDVVELLVKICRQTEWGMAYVSLKGGSEEAFVQARFGYRFSGDDIVEAGTDVENEAIDEARERLLADPRFADAEAKFVSALQKATSNRDTDYPEAVHLSVSALEGVARVLLRDKKITLDKALDRLRQRHNLNPNMTEMLKKLYHVRGNLEGAAHGAGTSSEHVARYCIHTSAAGMLYLIGECTEPDES